MKFAFIIFLVIVAAAIAKALQPHSHSPPPASNLPLSVGPNVCPNNLNSLNGINTVFYMKEVHKYHVVCNDGSTLDIP